MGGNRNSRKTTTRKALRIVDGNSPPRRPIKIPSLPRLRNRRGFQRPFSTVYHPASHIACDAGTGNMFGFLSVVGGTVVGRQSLAVSRWSLASKSLSDRYAD